MKFYMISTCAFSPLLILLFFLLSCAMLSYFFDFLLAFASTVAAPLEHIAIKTIDHAKWFGMVAEIFSFKKKYAI